MYLSKFPDRTITVAGKKMLYFGGTAYLGIPTNKAFQRILFSKIKQWGISYGSSRNSNVKLSIYKDFEEHFAKFTSSENSVVTSSGTLAGKLVLDTLCKEGKYTFYHYPKTHPAVIHKESKPLFIDNQLHPDIISTENKNIVISVDAILSGEITATSFNFLEQIPKEIAITLIVDESHSIGILGKGGAGITATIKTSKAVRKIIVCSLGKALGLPCGIIASEDKFITTVQNNKMYISSSGANAAYLNAFLEAQSIYQGQRKKLKHNLEYVAKHLKSNRYSFDVNYPVIYIENENIVSNLQENNIIITHFSYPTYKKCMNRIVFTANHKKKDIHKLIQVLNR